MKFPLLPTLIVAAAVATMIGLGIWQIGRASEKTALIERYRAAEGQPPVAWPALPPADDSLLYRRATGFCIEVTGWRTLAGRNRGGESGWIHVAGCRTGGLEGPGMQADMGWSRDHRRPEGWRGGEVSGVIAPDRDHRIRLVAEAPAPGLQPSARPNPEDLPNNHLFYTFQWFFFAAAAATIYLLALRRRQRPVADGAPKP
ncbi:MAG TPA: SURF1 family cytochrome oxidase biogenesis protein [Allosphingosinicella sp.]|nr:SURF1 family cytochrome oxidase biogenesis protein [Allosphingosinicella sp.]